MTDSRKKTARAEPGQEVADAIAAMPAWERAVAERLHDTILAASPDLAPRLWYGRPAYAKGAKGKVVCFVRGADIDGERYVTFGSLAKRRWTTATCGPPPTPFTKLTAADAKQIGARPPGGGMTPRPGPAS